MIDRNAPTDEAVQRTTLAGAGAVAFSVLTVVAFLVANPPGYHYTPGNVSAYLAHGHRGAVIGVMYLALLGVLGLICLLTHLRETICTTTGNRQAANIFSGCGLIAAASFAIGWGLFAGQILAHSEGGSGVVIAPPVTHLLSQIGVTLIFGPGAIMLGSALVVFALSSGAALPRWSRALTVVAGICGLAGLAYFPFYAVMLWILALGVWLLVGGRTLRRVPRARRRLTVSMLALLAGALSMHAAAAASTGKKPASILQFLSITTDFASTAPANHEPPFGDRLWAHDDFYRWNRSRRGARIGYGDATVSTAADQVRIVDRAMLLPVFARIVATPSATLPVAGTVHNTDTLLGHNGFVGVKTGSDDAAGGCFAFRTGQWIDGKHATITGVVLGQPGHDKIAAGLAAADAMVDRIAGHSPRRLRIVPGVRQRTPAPGAPHGSDHAIPRSYA